MLKVTRSNLQDILANIERMIADSCESKTQFYEESGISSSLYSQWNTGAKLPSMKSLYKIADYFDVPIEWLFYGEPKKVVFVSNEFEDLNKMRDLFTTRPELKTLITAAEGIPASVILEAAAKFMRYKEQKNENPES